MPLFDRDRYQRLDGGGRRPSSFCSTATIAVFVALCLVGAWMMASTSNDVPISVSPGNKSEAKEEDSSIDFIHSVNGGGGGGDTPQTREEAGDTGKRDEGAGETPQTREDAGGGGGEEAADTGKRDEGAGETPQTREDAGDTGKKDEGAGDTPQKTDDAGDTGKKGDDAGATQTTDAASNDVNRSGVAEMMDAASNGTTGGKPAGDTPSKNQTFSDENGKTEGGEVVKPEDTDKKAENSAEEATTGGQADKSPEEAPTDANENGGQADKNAEQNTEEAPRDTKDTGDQVDKNAEKASTDTKETGGKDEKNAEEAPTKTKETGGQADKSTDKNAEGTPTDSKEAGGGSTPKNQTAFDDENGVEPVKEDGKVAEKSPEEVASNDQDGDKVRATDDDTTAFGASKNQTFREQNDAPKNQTFALVDGINGTISEETEKVATNSSTTTEDKKPEAGNGDTAENAELLPSGQAELLNETAAAVAQNGTFPTQAAESSEEKKVRASSNNKKKNKEKGAGGETTTEEEAYVWKLCNVSAGADYIPCLDNEEAIKRLKSTKHYEHRERHCPADAPSCLVPLPEGYRRPIPWPHSRDKIWYHNVPHTKLASYKGNQNWVKVSGEHLTFPGGGTQFKHGAQHYIEVIQEAFPNVAWGRRSRVVLDVGCGVASFGGYLFNSDTLTMSLAPKDEHEAQVQFALERGIPAISAVMGTKRLPFPGGAFDVIHCARCRVPWHIEGGKLLLEVNRLLRPDGLFIWSATPVYRKLPEDVEIWHAMAALTKSMCWEMVKKTSDTVDQTALVVFKKPSSNDCYGKRRRPEPPLCEASDDPNAAWNITLQSCMHRVPTDPAVRGAQWPEQWPERLVKAPYWLSDSQVGVYGKPAPDDFAADYEHWVKVVKNSYLTGMGIDWKNVRNVMDMRAVYGGFAAALRDMKVWVMNIVTIDSPDTLPIIYERGLFGMYHDWCESFSTYPRSYDLLHADHLFSRLKNRCKLLPVIVEVDRILRPEGKLIVRDDMETVEEVQRIARSLHWEVSMTVSKQGEGLLSVNKTMWRPTDVEALS